MNLAGIHLPCEPMHPVLLTAATITEIKPFLDRLRTGSFQTNIQFDILVTGIGLVATTYSLSRQVMIKRPGLIIQAGIAGSFDRRLAIGTVVAVKKDRIADLGVEENREWKSLNDLKLVKFNDYPFKNGWLENGSEQISKLKFKKVNSISVNTITTGKKRMEQFQQKFHPTIESMEGAALHFISLMEKIPFIQLRSISNYAGDRNKKNWNIPMAIESLDKGLMNLLSSL